MVSSADVANAVERELEDGGMANGGSLLKGLEAPEPVFFQTIEPYSAVEQQGVESTFFNLTNQLLQSL